MKKIGEECKSFK